MRPDWFAPVSPGQFILSEYVRLYPDLRNIFDHEGLSYIRPDVPIRNPELEVEELALQEEMFDASPEPYDFRSDMDRPFISEQAFLEAADRLGRKKNVILQGSPGVGKTFIARKLAYQLIGRKADKQITMVQFHQSLAYEDFVQGLRLVKDGVEIRNGVFFNFCTLALRYPGQPFFFIIDEINRGNLSKIFGELMMLIEHDKRSEKYALQLTYADKEEPRFFVPPNVYLIGTMNTADRSLAIVDYALRRRFAFVTLEPEFGQPFRSYLKSQGISDNLTAHICAVISEINQKIEDDPNLGKGFKIGHSYFCDGPPGANHEKWFDQIVQGDLKPLLEEIWFDEPRLVEEYSKKLER